MENQNLKHNMKKTMSRRLSERCAKRAKCYKDVNSPDLSSNQLLNEIVSNRAKCYRDSISPELSSSPLLNETVSDSKSFSATPGNKLLFKQGQRLDDSFFMQPCISLAKALLGKILVRRLPTGEILKGRIVETESYLGVVDKASHSYKGKKTDRNEAMFLKPGTAYVYSIYGMYYCFNISSFEEGSAVLIRAIEPLLGFLTMQQFRSVKRSHSLKLKDLSNGPSKLCQAFNIEKKGLNKVDLSTSSELWLEYGNEIDHSDIISCKRIGIDSYGEEWANKPLRYYIKNCAYVSIRNKAAEKT